MTNYIILRKNTGMEVWEQFTAQAASSPQGAIRKAAQNEEDSADYVAVPARSWRPVHVEVNVERVLKLT